MISAKIVFQLFPSSSVHNFLQLKAMIFKSSILMLFVVFMFICVADCTDDTANNSISKYFSKINRLSVIENNFEFNYISDVSSGIGIKDDAKADKRYIRSDDRIVFPSDDNDYTVLPYQSINRRIDIGVLSAGANKENTKSHDQLVFPDDDSVETTTFALGDRISIDVRPNCPPCTSFIHGQCRKRGFRCRAA